jgi:hypothetical protein
MSATASAIESVKPICMPRAVSRRASWKRGGVSSDFYAELAMIE